MNCYLQILLLSLLRSSESSMGSECPNNQLQEDQLLRLPLGCFIQKYDESRHDGNKLKRVIDQRLAEYKRILQHIRMKEVKHIETTPVIKWAQSQSQIFITFKLSHRQDSPPCSDVRFHKFHLSNIPYVHGDFETGSQQTESNFSSFSFNGECFFTDQKFMFSLTLSFNATLSSIRIEKESFGTYTLIGYKAKGDIWIDPFEDVHRAAIWPEIREQYSRDMDTYFQMREERREKQAKKRKRKRRSPLKADQFDEEL